MRMLRDWLRIARSQTAAAVIMLCGMFFLLGGGSLFSVFGLLVVVFSILVHDFSFAHNSVIDVLAGYDTKDRFKSHFPLCNGKVRPLSALKVTHLGMFAVTFFAVYLCWLSPGEKFCAMSCYAVFVVCGFWYNEWTSKTATWDFVPISLCFTSLSLYAYFLVNTTMPFLVVLAAQYIFVVEWYEIGVAGEIKEIETPDEVGLLRKMGARCAYGTFNLGRAAFVYSWIVKLIGVFLLGEIIFFYNNSVASTLIYIVMSFAMIYFGLKLTRRQKWNRDKSLRYMAAEEIVSIFALPLVLIPIIDMVSAVVLIVFSLLYFLAMNYLNWKSFVSPKV